MELPRTALVAVGAVAALSISGCSDVSADLDGPADQAAPPPAADGAVDLPGDSQAGDDSPDGMIRGVLAADADGCV